jgi:hypothetical protein
VKEGQVKSYMATLLVTSILFLAIAVAAVAQEEPQCVENSPERCGEIGCSIVENKALPADLGDSVYWHVDRFESGERARELFDAALKHIGARDLTNTVVEVDYARNRIECAEYALRQERG